MSAQPLHEPCTSPARRCPNLPERAARVTPADVGDGVTTSLREVRTDEVVQLCRCIRGAAQTAQVSEGVGARPRSALQDLDRTDAAPGRATPKGSPCQASCCRPALNAVCQPTWPSLIRTSRSATGAPKSSAAMPPTPAVDRSGSVPTLPRAHPVPIGSVAAGQAWGSGFIVRLSTTVDSDPLPKRQARELARGTSAAGLVASASLRCRAWRGRRRVGPGGPVTAGRGARPVYAWRALQCRVPAATVTARSAESAKPVCAGCAIACGNEPSRSPTASVTTRAASRMHGSEISPRCATSASESRAVEGVLLGDASACIAGSVGAPRPWSGL